MFSWETPLPPITRVVLIGFRGSGKTTIGKEISRMLNWVYISTDELIEAETGCSISEFVEKEGWPAFRRLETKIIKALGVKTNVVIDSGGGMVENPENMDVLAPDSLVVWVDAGIEDIFVRLQSESNRPLLNQANLRQDIEYNYRRREPLYRFYSRLYVNTSESVLADICRKISGKLSS